MKCRSGRCAVLWALLLIALISAPQGWAQEETPADNDEFQKQWFMFWGAANIHARLEESEEQIDQQLNKTLGKVIVGYKNPITLKDWSDEFRLWEGIIGFGRDLSPKWSWFLGTGGTAGTVINDDLYLLPVPLTVKVSFGRRLAFIVGGVDYYPFGKPRWSTESNVSAVKKALSGTRPYFELASSYVRLKTIADGKVRFADAIELINKYEETDYDLFHISPRIGFETPIGKNDSIAIQAAYMFFNEHSDEFNNYAFYFLHKHRF